MSEDALAAARATLHRRAFADQPPRPWTAAEFQTLAATPGVVVVEAEAGFLVARLIGDEAEVLTLAIDPSRQRQGHGRALLAEAEARLKQAGCARILLEVAEDNAPARALYTAAGYRPVGRRKDYYASPRGPRVSAEVLAKTLLPGTATAP